MTSLIRILILYSFSLLPAFSFNPQLQKSYFSIKPNSPLSYELSQTHNGTIAHYIENSAYSRYILFDIDSGDAYPVLGETVAACQVVSPTFQHLHYHAQTDNLVYFCAVNSSLLFINQTDYTAQTAISLGLDGALPVAKLCTEGMNIEILVMDDLFTTDPKNSILIQVDLQSKQIISQIVFDQNFISGEAVVAYAPGTKTNYIATNIWQNNNLITKVYSIITLGKTYQITSVVDFTSSTQTITKLFSMGNYIAVNIGTTFYFLNNLGKTAQLANILTKELTAGILYPAAVRSTDGNSLYLHSNTLSIVKYTIVESAFFIKNLGVSQDMQILHANLTSSDLMFTYDAAGVFFNISDLQTGKNIHTAISSYTDLMLTDTTYTVVQNNTFYIFDLNTDSILMTIPISSSQYYYNKDQHFVTFLDTSCQVTHLDLASGKLWASLQLPADLCPGNISYTRLTEKGNPELVIPTNQSYLIISETYGQITFNTDNPTHDNDITNVNFDDLSFYYYAANQAAIQVNASFYIFNPQSQDFQLKSTNLLRRSVLDHGFFPINHNFTVALCDSTLTLFNQLGTQWSNIYANNFNLATGFDDQNGDLFLLFSFLSTNGQYPLNTTPLIINSSGAVVSAPTRENTVSGQATGPRSFALYDKYFSNIGVVRFFNSDPQDSKTPKTLIPI